MAAHSNLVGGSSAARFIGCIGSNDLIKRAPPTTTGMAAHTGTALHFVMEEVLNENVKDAHEFIGDVIEMDESDEEGQPISVEVTDDLIAGKVLPALDWFDNVLNPEQFWPEIRVEFSQAELEGAFGTADVLFVDGDRAGLVDWKFGDNVIVSAEDNAQLKFYLAAALHLQWFYDLTRHIDEFEGYIVQPIENNEEVAVRAVFTRNELLDFTTQLIHAKQAKDAGDTTLTIGEHCKFCPAETICPAWRDRGKNAIAGLKKAEADMPREKYKSGAKKGQDKPPSAKAVTKSVGDDMTHEDLAEFYLEVCEIAAWAESVKAYVKGEFDAGRPIDGLKKVVYQDERQWTDEKKAAAWVRRQGFKAEDYNEPAHLKSVAQIEKLVGKGKIKDDLVRKAPKGHSIVSMDDPRPAVDDANDVHSSSQQLAASLGKNS